jgi:hypothetical protein
MHTILLATNPVPKATSHEGKRSALRLELALHRRQQRVHSTIDVLVDDNMVEGALVLGLLVGDAEAIGDFAGHFGLAGDQATM